MNINQGTGTPAGLSLQAVSIGMGEDFNGAVNIGAAPVVLATTFNADVFTGDHAGSRLFLVLGQIHLIQTAGSGVVTVDLQQSLDGGVVWAAMAGAPFPGLTLDAAGVLGATQAIFPILTNWRSVTMPADRDRIRVRVVALVSAGAATGDTRIQCIAV